MKAMTGRGVGFLLGAVVALGSSLAARAAEGKSPFLPDGYKATDKPPEPPKPSPVDRYELRSIMVLNGVQVFSLLDTSNSKGFWIGLNETVEGVAVSDFHAGDESVLVRSGGKSRRLKLKEAKIVALKVAPPKPPVVAPNRAPVPKTGTAPGSPAVRPSGGTINNLSDEEVRARMQRVAEEIRRRRAMRRTMAEKAAKSQR